MAKKVVKKAKKKVVKSTKKTAKKNKPIGIVTHFYDKISVAIVKFSKPVKLGAEVVFRGASTDFNEIIKSIQFDHKPLQVAPKGKEVGTKVSEKVREGDEIYNG